MASGDGVGDELHSGKQDLGFGQPSEESMCSFVQMALSIKRDVRFNHSQFKARLVVQRFRQEYGVDVDEIFSPVVKMTTLRFMLGVVATENLELIKLDVKTTLLYGDLKEEMYMEQPKGFVVPDQQHLVCRLRKSLYGLKKAPR